MSEAPQILLNHRLKSLRLPTVLREYGKLARQAAAERLDRVRFLARLIELEMIDRERRMIARRIKAAKFPAVKGPPLAPAVMRCRAADEPGFVPPGKTGAELLFEPISQRYERGATFLLGDCCTITCQAADHRQPALRRIDVRPLLRSSGGRGLTLRVWRLTGALPDRLTHHVNILGMNGESYRLGPKQGPRDKA